jgi:uncharacterized protein (DUF305 family)
VNRHTLALLAAVPLTALTLSACGSASSTASSGSTSQKPKAGNSSSSSLAANPTDIAFAQAIIPPQQQALQMAKLASTHASSRQVKDLAARIEANQDPQLGRMTACLKRWKQGMPIGMMGMAGMPGMMSTADISELTAATGAAFDKKFLTLMIAHHTGAMSLATAELNHGADPAALAVAQAAIDGQTKEINEMQVLLDS